MKNKHIPLYNYVVKFNGKLFKLQSNRSYSKSELLRAVCESKSSNMIKHTFAKKLLRANIIRSFKPIGFPTEPNINGFVASVVSNYGENAG